MSTAAALIGAHRDTWRPGSFLGRLAPTTLQSLAADGELARFQAGERLTVEGEQSTDCFLLLTSLVKVTAKAGRSDAALLAIRAGGDVIGEIAARVGSPRTATVTACGREPVAALRFDREHLNRFLRDWPDAGAALESTIIEKLRGATRRRVDNAAPKAVVRLARALVVLAEDHGTALRGSVVVQVDLTQVEWGTMVGCSEKTVERAMAELDAAGLVEHHRRRTIVRNLTALRALAYDGSS